MVKNNTEKPGFSYSELLGYLKSAFFLTGVALALFVWFLCLIINAVFLNQGNFYQLLTQPGSHDIFTQSVISTIIIIFSFSGSVLLIRSKQASAALRENENRWQFAIEGSRDGVCDWNIVSNEVYYSRRWKEMLGYQEDEISNTVDGWDTRVHPDDKEQCYENLHKHFNGEMPFYEDEHRMLCKDGSYKWILERGKVITWTEDNKPLRMIGTHTDITERKQAEEALQFTQFSVEHFSEGLFWLGPDAQLLDVNETACKSLGYTREELLNMNVHDIDPDFPITVWETLWKRIKKQRAFTIESRHRTKNGRIFPVEISINYLEYGGKEYTCAVVRDITERKQAKNESRQIQELLSTFVEYTPAAPLPCLI